jgi:hypothetical protein
LLNRVRVLLKADTGENAGVSPALTNGRIAEMLETSTATVGRVRERFCRQGLKRSMPDRAYERSLEGRADARLTTRACSEAPEGRGRWSMRLLVDTAVELGVVGSVFHETVRKTLKIRALYSPRQGVRGPDQEERLLHVEVEL